MSHSQRNGAIEGLRLSWRDPPCLAPVACSSWLSIRWRLRLG